MKKLADFCSIVCAVLGFIFALLFAVVILKDTQTSFELRQNFAVFVFLVFLIFAAFGSPFDE